MNKVKDRIIQLIQKVISASIKFRDLLQGNDRGVKLESKINTKSDERLTEWERKVVERKVKTTEAKKAWEQKRLELSREEAEEI